MLIGHYDHIAKQWNRITGYNGGAFKKYVLNDRLIARIPRIADQAILELGAGNGYFMPLLLQRFSGQVPARIIITDGSARQIEIAQEHFHVESAEYNVLDVRGEYPCKDGAFDIILATMVFNEVSNSGLHNALAECHRVLSPSGLLLITVTHPAFIDSLSVRGLLKRERGRLTMPGAEGLRLPVVIRKAARYEELLSEAGFAFEVEDVYPDQRVLNEKPALRQAGDVPLGLIYLCTRA